MDLGNIEDVVGGSFFHLVIRLQFNCIIVCGMPHSYELADLTPSCIVSRFPSHRAGHDWLPNCDSSPVSEKNAWPVGQVWRDLAQALLLHPFDVASSPLCFWSALVTSRVPRSFIPYDYFLVMTCPAFWILAECGREATILPAELDRDVRAECVRGRVGPRSWVWFRRLGQHDQLRQASRHLWPLRQVLPVQAPISTRNDRSPLIRDWNRKWKVPLSPYKRKRKSEISLCNILRIREEAVISKSMLLFYFHLISF